MTNQAYIEALIARIALADRRAFSELYDATSGKLLSVCLKILNDQQGAEDALQDTYIKIWNNAGRYQTNGMSPMTWMITVARNTSIDRLRTYRNNHDRLDEIAELMDRSNGPEAYSIAQGETNRIAHCLEELDNQKAEAVCGVYLHGVSYAELASRYDIPLNTVRTWLRRSLLKLKGCLSND